MIHLVSPTQVLEKGVAARRGSAAQVGAAKRLAFQHSIEVPSEAITEEEDEVRHCHLSREACQVQGFPRRRPEIAQRCFRQFL